VRTIRPFRPFLAMALGGLLAGALAACGSAEPSADGAAGARPDDEAELAFARCMREAGIDIPDPGAGPRRVRIPNNVSRTKLESSMQTCRKKTGGGPPELTAEQRTEMRDAALKFAKCMRAHGADVPDPTVGDGPGGGGIVRMGRPGSAEAPAFRKAMESCQDELPFRGPGGNVRRAPGGGSTNTESGG
jgi:hypothetical protein